MEFLAQNVDFNRLSFNLLDLRVLRTGPQIWVLFQNAFLFYCTLYNDSSVGSINAVARNVIILANANLNINETDKMCILPQRLSFTGLQTCTAAVARSRLRQQITCKYK